MSYNIWEDESNNSKNHSTNFVTDDNPFNANSSYDIWKDNNDDSVLEREDSDLSAEEEEEAESKVKEDDETKQENHSDDLKQNSPEDEIYDDVYEPNQQLSPNASIAGIDLPYENDNESIKDANNNILNELMSKDDLEDNLFDNLDKAKPSLADLDIGAIDIEKNIFNDDDDVNIFGNDIDFIPTSDSKRTSKKTVLNDKKTHGTNVKKLFCMTQLNNQSLPGTSFSTTGTATTEAALENADDILRSPTKNKTPSPDRANNFEEITIRTPDSGKQQAELPATTPIIYSKNIVIPTTSPEKPDLLSISTDPVHQIEISDPYKVGDITNSFIEYGITAILSRDTVLKGRSLSEDDEYERTFTVKRRYSDFRWLYRQLQQSHWGIIVPSPPDKSLKNIIMVSDKDSVTRERKEVLLAMLLKMSSIKELQFDTDYLEFLTNIEVSKFSQFYKIREQETLSYASSDSLDLSEISRLSELKLFGFEDGLNFYNEAKGVEVEQYLKKKILQASKRGSSSGSGGSSFTKAIFGFASTVMNDEEEGTGGALPRYNEPDPFFDEAEECWDSLFIELKNLDTALKNLKESKEKSNNDLHKLATILEKLSNSNITESLNKLYESFANTQLEVSHVIKRSSDLEKIILSDYVQDQLRSLNNSTSIFNQRYKLGCILVLLEWVVSNKKFGKEFLEGENLKKWEQRYTSAKLRWREIGVTIKKQLFTFDITRVIEFRNCIEIYVETCKEQQKELIEIWETFYKETF